MNSRASCQPRASAMVSIAVLLLLSTAATCTQDPTRHVSPFKHRRLHSRSWYTDVWQRALMAWDSALSGACEYPSLECESDVTVPRSIEDDVGAGRCEPDVPGWMLCNRCTLLPVFIVDAIAASRCTPGCAPAPFDTCNTHETDTSICPLGASKVQCTILAAAVGEAPTTYTVDAPVFEAIASNLTSCTPRNATHHDCGCYLLRNDVLRAIAGDACVPACCRTEQECSGEPSNIIDQRTPPTPPSPLPSPLPLSSPPLYYSATGGYYTAGGSYSPAAVSPTVAPPVSSPAALPLPQWGSPSPAARPAIDALQPPTASPSTLLPLPNPGSARSPLPAPLPPATAVLSPRAYAPFAYSPGAYGPYAPTASPAYVPYGYSPRLLRSPMAGVQGPSDFGQCPSALQQYVCRVGGAVQVLDDRVALLAFQGSCRLDEHAARMVCGHTALDLRAHAALVAGACSRECLRPYPRCFPTPPTATPPSPARGGDASTSDMVPAPVVEGMASPSPTPTVCLLQEYTCLGARVTPALHAKILAAPNCTVLVDGLCMLPCGSIVSESVFEIVRIEGCTSECLLVGTPEVCVPAPRLQDLPGAPRRVLTTTPVAKEDRPARKVRLVTTTVLFAMGIAIAVCMSRGRRGASGATTTPLLG